MRLVPVNVTMPIWMVPQVGAWAEFGSNGLVSERLGVTSPTSIYRLGNLVVCFWG